MSGWQNLPAGSELRQFIARRAGWHMRKIWVGSRGIEYDFIVYDNDDRMIYQREITADDLRNEEKAAHEVWLAAMEDDETPRWDEDVADALWLIDRTPRQSWQENGQFHVWVGTEQYSAHGETESLALMRAWLAWAEDHSTF